MNIININERQFTLVLNREGVMVTDYYDTSKEYKVFFRRNERSNSPQGKLRLYYAQSSGLTIGTVFTFKGDAYVITSQDGVESNVYYTSLAVKCDNTFTFYSNVAKKYVTVPFVVASDKYSIARGQAITVTSGSVIIYTGLNEIVKDMTVNGYYENFGNAYKVGNIFCNNNLYYVYLEQSAKQGDTYTLVYNGVVTLDRSSMETYQLSYTAMKNGTPVANPTLVYTSSDETVATVSATGLVTTLKDGNVTITAKWTDQNIECSNVFTIIGEPNADIWNMTITGSTTIKVGYSKSYVISVTKNDVATSLDDIQYEILNPSNIVFTTNTYDASTQTITLKFSSEDYIDNKFTIHVYETEHSLNTSLEVTCASLY